MSDITSRIDSILSIRNKKRVDLSKDTGIPGSTVRQWIKGSIPNAEALYKVAKYLNVSMEFLVTGVTEDSSDVEKISNISKEESDLIASFRRLDDHDKNAVLTLAKSLEAQYSASEEKNTFIG